MSITGKTVLVVGASRGIGAEFVRQFAAKGNQVIAACRQPSQAKEVLEIDGVKLTTCDLNSPQSVERWAAEVKDITPTHIDYVINNAGIYGRRVGLTDVTAEDMLATFTTNCIGPLLVVQQLHRQGLLGGRQPTVVASVTSKVGSVTDNRSGGGYAYRASKSALNIVNKSLSIDLADDNVVCTLLHPGYVITDMTGGKGLIDKQTSVSGMIGVLEGGAAGELQLHGTWHDYKKEAVPW